MDLQTNTYSTKNWQSFYKLKNTKKNNKEFGMDLQP